MILRSVVLALCLLTCQQNVVLAATTWPASTDELEDIMMLNQGYRARKFADAVTPCSKGVGPGRVTAAEWLRVAFHDMATGNTYTGVGGLDASIAFEIKSSENIGTAFATTLDTWVPYFSSRLSLADIIAAGVYTATRSCGGPIIPIRGGRKDATASGPLGVPLPQNAAGTFRNQFDRMGYSRTEMIAFVACGHTLGAVHTENFPDIAPGNLDSTPYLFDNKPAIEFVGKTTKNPLGTWGTKKNADWVVFNSDNNVTISTLTDAQTWETTCRNMFQKMVEVVPSGVTLTSPVLPYEIKPYDLQLTLVEGGTRIQFSGEIRVRTTQRASQSINQVHLIYKDRSGTTTSNPIVTQPKGDASGFDDTFAFFGFSTVLPIDTSIRSFNVLVRSGETAETFDNNGSGFLIDDTVIFQAPQSCLDASGKLTVIAAARTGTENPRLSVVLKIPRASPNPLPSLSTATVAMATQAALGSYSLFSASYNLSGTQAQSAVFGVTAGGSADSFKSSVGLPTKCAPLDTTPPTSTPSPSAFAFQGCYSDEGATRALVGDTIANDTINVEACAGFCSTYQLFGLEYGRECYCGDALHNSSIIKPLSDCNMPCSGNPQQVCGAASRMSVFKNNDYLKPSNPRIEGYDYLGCYSEGSSGRALVDYNTKSDELTTKLCATFCNGSNFFGVEFGRECYCGAILQEGSTIQSASECSTRCAGNNTEWCGANNRLNLYKKSAISISSTSLRTALSSTSATTSNAATASIPIVSSSLSNSSLEKSTSSLSSSSASSSISTTRTTSLISSLSTTSFSGTVLSTLSTIPQSSSSTSWTSSSSSVTSTTQSSSSDSGIPETTIIVTIIPTPTSTPISSSISTSPPNPTSPTLAGYNYTGCFVDAVEKRLFTGKSQQDNKNSYANCAAFCTGYQFFGVEYGSECFCNEKSPSPATPKDDTECSMPCTGNTGNSTDNCGAANRLTVFKSLTILPPPSNPVIMGYNYSGCYTDSVGARVLDQKYLFDSNMSIAKCAHFCAGSKYFGTQYGGECYCGDDFGHPSSVVSEADCSFVCPGNKEEFCGAGNRLSLWTKIEGLANATSTG